MNEIIGDLWRKSGEYFTNDPLPVKTREHYLPINDCTLPRFGILRNARLTCTIELLNEVDDVHAAVLFRKNGSEYLGAGLGGWRSNYSLFVRNRAGIVGYPIGVESNISRGQDYEITIEFRAGLITHFSTNGENLILDPVSIWDTLHSALARGHVGLYTWNVTQARFGLSVERLPNRCFVITNINEGTLSRRNRLTALLQSQRIECELIDATGLRHERPLMRKIKEGITSADFVIADFGFQKPRNNVFYETGIAHSLGVPTIHLGPSGAEFDKVVPSDLKAQFFILEHELDQELPATVRKILLCALGNYDYLGGA